MKLPENWFNQVIIECFRDQSLTVLFGYYEGQMDATSQGRIAGGEVGGNQGDGGQTITKRHLYNVKKLIALGTRLE